MSLNDIDILKKEDINEYTDILYKYDSRNLRSTLYDFLAHRAIDFFMNERAYITQPAYKFELDSDKYFSMNNEFVNIKIDTKDTDSLKYKALLLFGDLIKFHLNDKNINALIDVDLKRIKFVRNNSILPLKDELYFMWLEKMADKYKDSEASALIGYEIANYYFTLGEKYEPEVKEEFKWFKKKAFDLCQEIIKKYPNSTGAGYCNYLISEIKKKSIALKTETVNIIDKPFLALVDYNNVDKLYLRIIKISDNDRSKVKRTYYHDEDYEKFIKYLKSFKPVDEWTVNLPLDGDFNIHSAEIKMPALKAGYYLIIASADKELLADRNAVFYTDVWISNISFIKRYIDKDASYDVYVFDRDSGKPIENVDAQIYIEQYDYNLRDYKYIKKESYTTDKNGYFRVKPENRTFTIEFKTKDDRLNLIDNSSQGFPYGHNYPIIKTFFFTDRSIYRPGQTIYFKGLVIESKLKNNRIMPNRNVSIEFYDANGERLNGLNLKTNEYGTFNGSFTAPVGKLNGLMTIRNTDNSGYVQISVEEYKRPKFEVNFETVKESYKVNEDVKIKLNAKSYAGANIDNAIVNYRVVRTVNYPYWYWWWGYYPQPQQQEITHGTGTTDADGNYEIKFKALPDLSISKDMLPVFNYMITADVVDINGETHSATSYVRVGYVGMEISINLADSIDRERSGDYSIISQNLNGEYQPSKGTIKIYKLKDPKKIYKERYWKKPDRFIISEEDFKKDFPYDQYKEENNYYKWEKDFKMMQVDFDTDKNKIFRLIDVEKWDQGRYVLELKTKDKDGVDINYVKYFTLYSMNDNAMPYTALSWSSARHITAQPGDRIQVDCGSSDIDMYALFEIENENEIVESKIFDFSNGKKIFNVDVTERNRGNFIASITMIKHNRIFNYDFNIYVPWSNKELKMEFMTFRNKLLPGQDEEWKIKITDSNKDKALSEMVATLYDKSLDAFKPHGWYVNFYPYFYKSCYWQYQQNFNQSSFLMIQKNWNDSYYYPTYYYDSLNWFNLTYHYYNYKDEDKLYLTKSVKKERSKNGDGLFEAEESPMASEAMDDSKADQNISKEKNRQEDITGNNDAGKNEKEVQIRKNFNETAFFYPELKTDKNGEIIISFKIPEALTKWRMLGFAHTKDLKYGFIENELVTQKELMITPNPPRFFREDDKIFFSAKINNLSDRDLSGEVMLELFDAITMKSINSELKNTNYKKQFKAKKGASDAVNWELNIPIGVQAITYRIIAKANDFSDGEEAIIPVLTNRMLVTESLPLPVKGKTTKKFNMQKLIDAKKSNSLQHERLTLEFVTNPTWYAIQALPYLIEYPYECSEQVFSRYYANSIASHIVNSNPRIKQVFEKWKNTDALLSNLQKNEELKQVLLEETPWVYEAKNEEQRKKMVGILFDLNNVAKGLNSAINKLANMQLPNGGFPWFAGLPDDRYITQHIICGLARLQKIGIESSLNDNRINNIVDRGLSYLDKRIAEDYEYLIKNKYNLKNDNIWYTKIQYLYLRSFFMNKPIPQWTKKAFDYYKDQAIHYWLNKNRYMQGMIGIALNRYGEKKVAFDIIKSLKENSIMNEEMGMYWKDLSNGYYWYEAPIETESLLIEAFSEIANDTESVDNMKVWLLKQKQTQDWKTTKATTDACYALILTGSDWLSNNKLPEITLGDIKIDPDNDKSIKVEYGTGYFKTSWVKDNIKESMGNVTVINKNDNVAWGALYWQYFENLDKITPHKTPLKIEKRLFLEVKTDKGPVLKPINDNNTIKTGDLVKVRIILTVDRDMEYIHMKDMRASGLEPVNVISTYKYQGGLWYYESTKDASTNFFIPWLSKGTYVFEYPLRANNKGNFSNGITTIQCMYAPEFSSHSEGIRIEIK
jgi:hypothetical protein